MIDLPAGLPSIPVWWVIAAIVVVIAFGVIRGLFFDGDRGGKRAKSATTSARVQRQESTRWATPKDVPELVRPKGPYDPTRILLGWLGNKEICNPRLRSLLVLAPTGAGKTPAVIVPAILRHHGPAVVTSVKADVMALTRHRRAEVGPVLIFDPFESTGPSARWSPLAGLTKWEDALDAARWIQDSNKAESGGIEDRDFWDSQSRRMLAPLLWLAANRNLSMKDVAALVSEGPSGEARVTEALRQLDCPDAVMYWQAFCGQPDRTKGSVLGTAFTVLEAWTHPRAQKVVGVRAEETEHVVDIDRLLDEHGTLYMVCPSSDQAQFSSIFEALINAVMINIERRYHYAGGQPLDPPLLLALDEAANIAPLRKLDQFASEKAGQGVVLISVWQSEGQIEDRYGASKARTIVANHTAKMYLPGIQDNQTLENLSKLIGRDFIEQNSHQSGSSGYGSGRSTNSSVTKSVTEVDVAPAHVLREMGKGQAVVITSNTKPMRLRLSGWFDSAELRARVDPEVAALFDRQYAAAKKSRRGAGR